MSTDQICVRPIDATNAIMGATCHMRKINQENVSRRGAMSILGMGPMAAAALTLVPRESLASPAIQRVSFDPSNQQASVKAFLKLIGSLGNETVRRWFTGKIYAYLPGEQMRELFYFDGFYLEQYKALEDGSHLSTRFEVTIKRDLLDGKLLTKWENPFTGRSEDVANSVGGPQLKVYNQWGFDRPDRVRTEQNPLMLDWLTINDTAIVTWDIFWHFQNPLQPDVFPLESSGVMLDLVNLTNFVGSLNDIENPDIQNASSLMYWNGVTGWEPWMRMGQKPGALVYKAIGVKVSDFNEIPSLIFDETEKAFPGHLSEQRPWTEGNYEWFDKAGTKWDDLVK